jgi:hypothetical protein
MRRPPTIAAPTNATVNATSSAGAPYTISAPASQTCDAGPCIVAAYIHSVKYAVGTSVTLSVNTTTLVYIITDSTGQSANSTCTVTVLPPLYVR